MKHFLENTYQEIKNTQSIIDNLKSKSIFTSFIQSFKKRYIKYSLLKKTFLLNYSSLFSDIQEDINTKNIVIQEIDNVKNSIVYITDTIESCVNSFHKLKGSSAEEEHIIQSEKIFLINGISSFHKDMKVWIQNHSREIVSEISKLQKTKSQLSHQNYKATLDLQIKRLETQIQKIGNLQ